VESRERLTFGAQKASLYRHHMSFRHLERMERGVCGEVEREQNGGNEDSERERRAEEPSLLRQSEVGLGKNHSIAVI
jgi:hypothetical protein